MYQGNVMTNATSIIEIFKVYLGHSSDPFINSMKGLPADVLDSLLADLVKKSEISYESEKLRIEMDINAFKRRVKGAFKSQVLEDEVGVLIQYGASKNVISEVTGVHPNKIVFKRKTMDSNSPGIGRPKTLDPVDKQFILDCWSKFEGTKAVKLVRTHHFTDIHINAVWLVVKGFDTQKISSRENYVPQQDNNTVTQ